MNKSELTESLASKLNLSKYGAAKVLDTVLDEIVAQVAAGERVVITGFGIFDTSVRNARTARNPQTGEQVQVPAKVAPTFKAGAAFKSAVNV